MIFQAPLIAVKDMEKSVQFYTAVLEQQIICDFGANKTLSGGLALQTLETWQDFINKKSSDIMFGHNCGELYFEENDMDKFLKKLKSLDYIEFVHEVAEQPWGQRIVRFYDPDMNIIEVGENMDIVIMRFINSGMSIEQTAARMNVPCDYVAQTVNKINANSK